MADDTISRRAAIDALNASMIFGRCNEKTVTFKALKKYAEGVRERIEALPSAKPQITECEHCLAYDPFDNGIDGFCRKMGKVMCVSDFCSYAERKGDG